MGYTHYWTQMGDLTTEEMGTICDNIAKIIDASDVTICDGSGEPGSFPVLKESHIAFNGDDEDGHETFFLSRERRSPWPGAKDHLLGWGFCKTARKPYDVVVTACLTYLSCDWGFDIASDGEIIDWQEGLELAQRALGREFPNPLIVKKMIYG